MRCKLQILVFTLLIPFLVAPISAHAEESSEAEAKTLEVREPKIIVKVNGTPINELDLQGEVNALMPGQIVHGSIPGKKIQQVKDKALKRLIENELVYQEGQRRGLKVEQKTIKKRIKVISKKYKKPIKEILEDKMLTMAALEKVIEKGLLINKMYKLRFEEIEEEVKAKVTDEYMREFYEKNKKHYITPEKVHLRELLIKGEPGSSVEAWTKVMNRAEALKVRILNGEDFAKIAEEFSESPYASKGGDMGFTPKGGLAPEIEYAIEGKDVGSVIGPIWTIYGYHLIKIEEKTAPVQGTFDEAKEALKDTLENMEFKTMRAQWIDGLKKNAKIEHLLDEDESGDGTPLK
jgi:peptidyl-prolyl cis-trans isomerase C